MLADLSLALVIYQTRNSLSESWSTEILRMQAKVSIEKFDNRVITNAFVYIVTSKWHYSRDSELQRQDKDFKRLNKSSLGNRATTAHQQYLDRQQSDMRIRHPT